MTLRRRDFIQNAAVLSAAGIFYLPALAAARKPVTPNRFAMLADTHIRVDREELSRGLIGAPGISAAGHLQENIRQILAQPEQPVAAIICGDCAFLYGKPGDYAVLSELLLPLRKAGVPIYLILGNHDNRHAFWKAFPKQKVGIVPLTEEEKHLKVVSTPEVNLLLLDSLIKTNYEPGSLGDKQLQWVDQKLKTLKDKPLVFMAHHHPSDIKDYAKFLKIANSHPQAKAFFYGHLHEWYQKQDGKIWEISLPASAYVFDDRQPSGWVDSQFHKDGVKLTLHTIDKKHPKQGEVVELAWDA